MSDRLLRLADRIRSECQDLDRVLDEYRGFRHIVRNVYTFRFDPAKMQQLVENAPAAWAQAQAELLAFANFVEQQADSN